jgi:hypothetical protein
MQVWRLAAFGWQSGRCCVPRSTSAIAAQKSKEFDHEILLLQGGGALGAYQAGLYEGQLSLGEVQGG